MANTKMRCPSCGSGGCFWSDAKQIAHCFACDRVFQRRDLTEVPHGIAAEHSPLPSVSLEGVHAHADACRYLLSRRVPREQWDQILFEPDERALYFRIWSPSLEFAPSYHCRFIGGGKMRWRSFPGTKKEHYLFGEPKADRVVLVEGIFDALRIGPGAVALLGSDLYPTQKVWLERFQSVIVWGDPDPAGLKLMNQVHRQVTTGPVVYHIPYTDDPTEVGWNKEPGDCLPGHPLLEGVLTWLKD